MRELDSIINQNNNLEFISQSMPNLDQNNENSLIFNKENSNNNNLNYFDPMMAKLAKYTKNDKSKRHISSNLSSHLTYNNNNNNNNEINKDLMSKSTFHLPSIL